MHHSKEKAGLGHRARTRELRFEVTQQLELTENRVEHK